jgi:hypothetical protein
MRHIDGGATQLYADLRVIRALGGASTTGEVRDSGVREAVELVGARTVLAGVHQLHQGCVLGGEPDVRRSRGLEAFGELRAGAVERCSQLGAQALEADDGEGIEEGLSVGEMAARSSMADADLASELAQGELVDAVLPDGSLSGGEQRWTKMPVVVGAFADLGHTDDLR